MKNQYFGDKRDLLKYSLLETLASGLPGIRQLTCIWMLTAPAVNNDGNRHFASSRDATRLELFLNACVTGGRRDVRNLATYMSATSVRYLSYGDDPSSLFSAESRQAYFGAIPRAALKRSIVFFDPDNGLEPDKSCRDAHLSYRELDSVFTQMDRFSTAVIYQHLPRRPPTLFWPELTTKLRARLHCSVGYIAAGDVGFLIALRSVEAEGAAAGLLEEFRFRWSKPLAASAPSHAAL